MCEVEQHPPVLHVPGNYSPALPEPSSAGALDLLLSFVNPELLMLRQLWESPQQPLQQAASRRSSFGVCFGEGSARRFSPVPQERLFLEHFVCRVSDENRCFYGGSQDC